ncbi:MAG: Ca2+-binding EF-hand superfamily protein [Pseudohongiellaceae bacterium]
MLWTTACSTTSSSSEPDTVWQYLADKYDADGDGSVLAAEYDRGAETFGRLDKNGDGALDPSDFASSAAGGMAMTPERMAPMILSRGFQRDDDPALTRDEVIQTFAALDADQDGSLVAAEATPAYTSMRAMMDRDFHAMLVSAADENGDGELSELELLQLFDRLDQDSDGALTPVKGRGNSGSRQGSESAGDVQEGGEQPPASKGLMAPDFTLKPVSGNGDAVQLSCFRGDRPVALIFGSYT